MYKEYPFQRLPYGYAKNEMRDMNVRNVIKNKPSPISLVRNVKEMNDACNTLLDNFDWLLHNEFIKKEDYMYCTDCISGIDELITDIEEIIPKESQPQKMVQEGV